MLFVRVHESACGEAGPLVAVGLYVNDTNVLLAERTTILVCHCSEESSD
jgi:hypothetical protein